LRIIADLIGVQQGCLKVKLDSASLTMFDFLSCTLHSRNRIACARTKVHDFNMDMKVRFTCEVIEKLPITLFRLALTAKEDGSAPWNDRPAATHPICGTPP
jgi:hypothetical protein